MAEAGREVQCEQAAALPPNAAQQARNSIRACRTHTKTAVTTTRTVLESSAREQYQRVKQAAAAQPQTQRCTAEHSRSGLDA
jgi:hypothetical protein